MGVKMNRRDSMVLMSNEDLPEVMQNATGPFPPTPSSNKTNNRQDQIMREYEIAKQRLLDTRVQEIIAVRQYANSIPWH